MIRNNTTTATGEAMLDLWQVEIGPEVTKPGENYYVIQLKGWDEGGTAVEGYLLRDTAGSGQRNDLGQAWTSDGDYFGHDWSLTVIE